MKNLLWLAVLFVFLAAIILFVVLGASYNKNVNENIQFENVSCIGPLNEFPDIEALPKRFTVCFNYSGQLDSQRFYDVDNDWTIAPIPRSEIPSAQSVCSGICKQTQLPLECLEKNEEYNECIRSLLPQNCSDPAVPVARKGNTFYYVVGKSKIECF